MVNGSNTKGATAPKRKRPLAKHGGRATSTVFIPRPMINPRDVKKNKQKQKRLTKEQMAIRKAVEAENRAQRASDTAERVKQWKATCKTIRVPHTYAALLKDQAKEKEVEMQERFIQMQKNPSTIQIDIDSGARVTDKKGKTLIVVIPNGIPSHILQDSHFYSQELSSAFPDSKRGHSDDARHASTGNAHYFPTTRSVYERRKLESDPKLSALLEEQDAIEGVKYAHEGVALLHLAHTWCEQGKKPMEGGLTPSAQLLGSGSSHRFMDMMSYMRHTEPLAEVVGLTYKLIEAQFHDHMQLSFQAGKLYESAVGPYLARALIYKLQVDAHLDRRDHGLSAMTNSGRYYRGYLYFPQFWMRVKYTPGTLVFLKADRVWHGVGEWRSKAYAPGDVCTPGRIAYVFFTHQEAHDALFNENENFMVAEAGGTFGM